MYFNDDKLTAVFTRLKIKPTGDALVDAATTTLLDRIDTLIQALSKIDYETLRSEYDSKLSKYGVNKIPADELKHLCSLEETIHAYVRMSNKKDEAVFTIVALDFFLSAKSKPEILTILEDDPLSFKHQVLTRYGWIKNQKQLMDSGKSFNMPFLCDVGSSDRRKGIDREFFVLLHFLPLYNDYKKAELLFEKHQGNDCPDFLVNDFKQMMGIEITEATASAQANLESKEREAFIDLLKNNLAASKSVDITIWSKPSWQTLNKNGTKIIQWLSNEMDRFLAESHNTEPFYSNMEELNLNVQLGPSKNARLWEMGPERFDYGQELENALGNQIATIIEKKLKASSSPNIRPTILVIYVNEFLVTQPNHLVDVVSARIGKSFKDKFNEIWFLCDSKAFSIERENL